MEQYKYCELYFETKDGTRNDSLILKTNLPILDTDDDKERVILSLVLDELTMIFARKNYLVRNINFDVDDVMKSCYNGVMFDCNSNIAISQLLKLINGGKK